MIDQSFAEWKQLGSVRVTVVDADSGERIPARLTITDDYDDKHRLWHHPSMNYRITAARRSWVLREVFRGFSEEARTRSFASLTLVSFALLDYSVSGKA